MDSVSDDFLVIFAKVQSMYLQNTIRYMTLCSCGLEKLWVKSTSHFPKILIFQQLSLKHFLRHPCDISIRRTAFVIQAGKLFTSSRSSHQRCSIIKGSPNFTKFTGKTYARASFSIMLRASDMQVYQKRNSGANVFLWIFRNF